MNEKVKANKDILFNDGSKSLITKSLDNMEITFWCTVTGTQQSQDKGGLAKGRGVQNVKVRLNFAATTLHEAMRFASGGQSFRVACQSRLRMTKVEKLTKDTQVFSMSEIFNPPKAGFTWTAPSMKKLRVLEDMLNAGDIDQDLFDVSKERFDAAILVETAEHDEAKKG